MPRNRIVIGVVIAVVAIVGAAVWALADSGGGSASLGGTSWTLSDLDSAEVTGTAPTLAFTEEGGERYRRLQLLRRHRTRPTATRSRSVRSPRRLMACEGPILEQETVYFAALEGREPVHGRGRHADPDRRRRYADLLRKRQAAAGIRLASNG